MKTQTDSRKYEGQCKFCKKDISKRQIIDHLDFCPERRKDKNSKNLRLRIADPYCKNYWLVAEITSEAKFKDLDYLIRKVWVECCGHLSLFGDYANKVGMNRIISETLEPGNSLGDIYDFGSSTELVIEAVGYSYTQLNNNKKIELVAQNYLPPSRCLKCGHQATNICTSCSEEETVLVCDSCAKKYHDEDNEQEEHYILPLANSPRSGVCGYEPKAPLDDLF